MLWIQSYVIYGVLLSCQNFNIDHEVGNHETPTCLQLVSLRRIRLKNADPELRTRLAEWLAYHLSNFEYVWPWPKWGHVLTAPPHHPQRCACKQLITCSHVHATGLAHKWRAVAGDVANGVLLQA